MSLKIKVSKKVKNQCESTRTIKSQVEIMDETKRSIYVKFPIVQLKKKFIVFGIVIKLLDWLLDVL